MTDAFVELESLTPSLAAGVEARKLQGSLGRAVEKLAGVPRQVERLEALVQAAIALGAAQDSAARHALQDVAREADEIGGMLERARTPDDLQHAIEELPQLNQALANLDGIVRQLWRELAQGSFRSLAAVGDLLARIGRTRGLGEQLGQVGRRALALADRSGPAEQLAPEIQLLCQQRAALDAELHELADNPEVDAFLTAVTRGTATLGHVTIAVVAWLERYEALTAFAVRGAA